MASGTLKPHTGTGGFMPGNQDCNRDWNRGSREIQCAGEGVQDTR